MSGYTNRYIPLPFPELGDKVSVLIRNPRLLPPTEIEPEDVPTDADGKPTDLKAAENAGYAILERLIVAWHVYDASAATNPVDIDMDAADLDEQLKALEAVEQPRLGPITRENIAKLPAVIMKKLMEEVQNVLDPS